MKTEMEDMSNGISGAINLESIRMESSIFTIYLFIFNEAE